MSRTIIIGDVHGCLDELRRLLDELALEPTDQLFFAGDLMDRGPDPVGCVRLARERGARMVLGNHEEKHLRFRRHEAKKAADPSYVNPMQMFGERAAQNAALTADEVAWLEACPVTLALRPGWVLVHAGLFPGKTLEEQVKDRKLRDKIIRLCWVDKDNEFVPLEDDTANEGPPGSKAWMTVYDGPLNVVYGHAVHSLTTPRVDVRPQGVSTYGIDTGCCFGGRLTAMVLHEDERVEFVQVEAQRAYAERRVPKAKDVS